LRDKNLNPLLHFTVESAQHKHTIETVYFDRQQNRSYSVRVGLTSLEDKLINSFLGLPFAILESLFYLLNLLVWGGGLVLITIVCTIGALGSPFVMLFASDNELAELKRELQEILPALIPMFKFLILETVSSLAGIIARPLLAIIKIPVGIGIGIDALIKLAQGKDINPPTISDLDSLDNQNAIEQRLGPTVKIDYEFEIALEQINFDINTIPKRYICEISGSIIKPVLLNDGYFYTEYAATRILQKQNPVGSYDRTPLLQSKLSINTYHAEIKALVDALVAEHEKATTENRAPNYAPILQCAEQHSKIASALHENISEKINAILRNQKDIDLTKPITIMVADQSYSLSVSAKTIQAALDTINPIIGQALVNKDDSFEKAAQIFLGKLGENRQHTRLFVTGLTESILAEQNFAQAFTQVAATTNATQSAPSAIDRFVLAIQQFDFWSNPPIAENPAANSQQLTDRNLTELNNT